MIWGLFAFQKTIKWKIKQHSLKNNYSNSYRISFPSELIVELIWNTRLNSNSNFDFLFVIINFLYRAYFASIRFFHGIFGLICIIIRRQNLLISSFKGLYSTHFHIDFRWNFLVLNKDFWSRNHNVVQCLIL